MVQAARASKFAHHADQVGYLPSTCGCPDPAAHDKVSRQPVWTEIATINKERSPSSARIALRGGFAGSWLTSRIKNDFRRAGGSSSSGKKSSDYPPVERLTSHLTGLHHSYVTAIVRPIREETGANEPGRTRWANCQLFPGLERRCVSHLQRPWKNA